MPLSEKRTEEIAVNVKAIVTNMNAMKEEELEEILSAAAKEEALGPLLDPTAYAYGGMSEATRGTKKVVEEILRFKRVASGIGNFR